VKGIDSVDLSDKFKPGYEHVKGGLFDTVEKADVGNGIIKMMKDGVTLLCWADPFFPEPSTPEFIKETAHKVINSGEDIHYTMPVGRLSLKERIAQKMNKKGYNLDPSRNIIITPGADAGLFFAMFPFIAPGDEVLVHDPSYPNNFQNVTLMGGTLVRVPLKKSEGYALNADEFEKRITSKTKMVVLTNPNNPTSTVFRKKEIEDLCRIIVKHDLILVVDQAFEDILYDGLEMTEAALLPGMWERTLVVCSTSKGMGLSGYRVGYIVAQDGIMDKLYGSAVAVIGTSNTLAQICAEAAYENDEFIDAYKEIFDRRRKYLYEKMNRVPGVSMIMPESSFLAWVDVSALGESGEVVQYLAKEAKCLVNDGNNYGEQGAGHIRIVFGCLKDDDLLFDAIGRIAEALGRYSERSTP